MRAAVLAATLAAAALPALAQVRDVPPAQYRPGLPAVNAAPPPSNPDSGNYATSAAFARWNEKAGKPSILLFWNRELVEDSASQYDSVVTERLEGSTDQAAVAVRGRRGALAASSADTSIAYEQRSYQERSNGGDYGFRNNHFSRAVESSLMSTFLAAGGRVMDREALIRKVSANRSRDDRMDVQHLETLALERGVQYLVEVLPDDDGASPTGVSFTVKVLHLPTGAVKAQFVTQADPPRGESRFVATRSGFEKRAPESRATPELIGAQLAYETMSRLR